MVVYRLCTTQAYVHAYYIGLNTPADIIMPQSETDTKLRATVMATNNHMHTWNGHWSAQLHEHQQHNLKFSFPSIPRKLSMATIVTTLLSIRIL